MNGLMYLMSNMRGICFIVFYLTPVNRLRWFALFHGTTYSSSSTIPLLIHPQ